MRLTDAFLLAGASLLAIAPTACTTRNTEGAVSTASVNAMSDTFAEFNDEGDLLRPSDYRSWVYIGTPLTPNDMNNGKATFPEFHNVYIDPVSFEHYKNTGGFREGTVLIKELVSVGSKNAVSGNGYFMGEFRGLEATIKSKEHFPNEPGSWAYFTFGHDYPLAPSAKAEPTSSCNSCHETSAADDFVFTQYYPVLRVAKGARGNPENTGNIAGRIAATATSAPPAPGPSPDQMAATAPTPSANPSGIPTDKQALFKFLKEGAYKSFPAKESGTHASRGPHSVKGTFGQPVRSYLNSTVLQSLEAGNKTHPVGSGIVKEMFGPSGELQGWAVSIKTQEESDGGKGWFWYESTSTVNPDALVANGNGVPLCFGCHSSGSDYVLSSFPLQ